jgi:hypothetical protein
MLKSKSKTVLKKKKKVMFPNQKNKERVAALVFGINILTYNYF